VRNRKNLKRQKTGMAENAEMSLDTQVFASLPRDAELICDSLTAVGITCRNSPSPAAIAADIPSRADIIVLFEEALDETAVGVLVGGLKRQEPWSDIPIIVLTGGGGASQRSQRLAKMSEPLGNVTFIERPVRPITLISSVRAAIRAREKQYEIRGHLKRLQEADEALQRSHEGLERQVVERTATLRQLSASLMRSQDEERRRIARELHDSLGQYLAALSMELHRLFEGGDSQLTTALKTLETCISETRTISHLLHPPLLDEVGLTSAVRWYVEGFEGRSGIKVTLEIAKIPRLSPDVETAVFRVLQEALTNIHRHSRAERAEVSFAHRSSEIVLDIVDYGKGMPKTTLNRFVKSGTAGGVGLAGMRERIREIGGDLRIDSNSAGTHVTVSVPLRKVGSPETSET
jgi:signal transduction histidine kinase